MCEVGVTVYTYCGFILEIHAFCGAIYTNTVQVSHEGGPVPCQRKMVLKAEVKIVEWLPGCRIQDMSMLVLL